MIFVMYYVGIKVLVLNDSYIMYMVVIIISSMKYDLYWKIVCFIFFLVV